MMRGDAAALVSQAGVLALLVLSGLLAAPAPAPRTHLEDFHVVQRRAALVLDRLLVAMERALHDDAAYRTRSTRHEALEGPRTAALRVAPMRVDGVRNPNSRTLRGHSVTSMGRAVQCYFNAITCF